MDGLKQELKWKDAELELQTKHASRLQEEVHHTSYSSMSCTDTFVEITSSRNRCILMSCALCALHACTPAPSIRHPKQYILQPTTCNCAQYPIDLNHAPCSASCNLGTLHPSPPPPPCPITYCPVPPNTCTPLDMTCGPRVQVVELFENAP